MSVYIVAEVGSGHMGALHRALELIDIAADVGADACKFQMYRIDRFIVPRYGAEALRPFELPVEWLPDLADRALRRRIDFLCTAFDLGSLEAIDPYVLRHKVGSYEAAQFDFVEAVLAKGKPTMVSLGVARPNALVMPPANDRTTFLICESVYPAPIAGYLRDDNTLLVDPWGVSDHTLHPTIVPCAAVARGAVVVEKHMRWWNDYESPDAGHSISPDEFAQLVTAVRLTEDACA